MTQINDRGICPAPAISPASAEANRLGGDVGLFERKLISVNDRGERSCILDDQEI